MHYKKLVTRVESHANAVSLLKRGEQHYIKAINNNKGLTKRGFITCHGKMTVQCSTASILLTWAELTQHMFLVNTAYKNNAQWNQRLT